MKFVMMILALAISVSAFADINMNKTGSVLIDALSAQPLPITIDARSGAGTLTLGNMTFKITNVGTQGVYGTTANNEKQVQIFFHKFADKDMQDMNGGANKVDCSGSVNAAVILYEKTVQYANCATLQ